MRYDFALSYFDDELREQGLDPDYANKYDNGKRNPVYYTSENEIEKYFGWRSESSGSGKQNSTIKDDWDNGYNIKLLEHLIVAKDDLKLIAKPLKF